MRRHFALVPLLAAMVWVTQYASPAAEAPAPANIKIAIVNTFTKTITPAQFQVMATTFGSVIQAQARLKGQLVMGGSPDEICKQLTDGSLQFGVLHGIEYAWMKQKHADIEPVMINILNPEWLQPVVVVAKDSPAKTLADCKGQRLAIMKSAREDTRLYFNRLCTQNGGRLEELFSDVQLPPNTEETLDDLVDGDFQVVVLEQSGLSMFQRLKPARFQRLKVLDQSEPFPTSCIVYRKSSIPETTIKTFRNGMGTAHNSVLGGHLLSLMKIRRFELPTDEYHKHLAGAMKLYPPAEATNLVNTTVGNASK